ncbi:molybdenum ABC transporter ATP-binding protein [Siccirubricoccus sp. G192]|uniref:molybdenum ABC transporter ATP-binding protein n=1 Tax=Siccirubricoccus sp. G192 TaxID=2849651 RepID=UPI001C2BDCCC|nr:molybdenum ABC transporter ATP-binding protein [Siccirubricoccus sp. G192]MBV1799959.1 molybdenum ABC transporter ATP-binding protein [Siccirubricoccus sp. G192]
MLEVALRHDWPPPRGGEGFSLDIAFAAPTPGVTVLFGPSGCGKSTILAAVAGLLRPRAGRVALDGTVLTDTASGLLVPAERRRCGVVFQEARLFPHLSVESNLRYGARRAPREATGPGFGDVVALLGIGGLLRRRPAGLSGGERQRVALGRALLARPLLLLLDEPLASLDLPRRAEVLPLLERVRDTFRVPMLHVTHALEEVDRLADTLVLLQAGRVLASGTPEALTSRPDLPLLAGRRDAGAVLRCLVAGHDPGRGLSRLDFAGGSLLVPLRPEPAGTRLRLRLRARDVALATRPPEGLATHNVLPATVESIGPAPGSPHEVLLRLLVGPTPLLVRLTRDAVGTLGLAPGQGVWALVKSIAFDHGGPA